MVMHYTVNALNATELYNLKWQDGEFYVMRILP